MDTTLPFFNWSLKKVLLSESSEFNKSRLRILYVIILLSLLKALIVITIAAYHQQQFQLIRASIVAGIYVICLKLLLYDRSYQIKLTHVMIIQRILIIWSALFISAQSINVIIMQFIFMVMLSSFFLLDMKWGLIYSLLSILPTIFFFISEQVVFRMNIAPAELAYPGGLIMVVLNFVTIVMANYLYHGAFRVSMAEKDSLNSRLQESVQEANMLAQSKSDFLSTMSHELRTPLNAVIGITDILLEEPFDNRQKENLHTLKFSGVSLLTLINNILDFNKLDSDKLYLEDVPVKLSELIGNMYSGLDFQARVKGISLYLHIDESLQGVNVMTDPTRLMQIIYNLAGNAIKFTQHGSVTLSLQRLDANSEGVKVRFMVSDTGIGIEKEKQGSIFEPFTQASSAVTRNFGGTGLGLAIVKRLLDLFKSSILLESSVGQGSAFSFEILFVPAQEELADLEESGHQNDLSGMKVLIAEDNPVDAFLMQRLCERWKISYKIVENGEQAVKEARANIYHVILMDIHMPMLNGYEATIQIREISDPVKANVPIIALTATIGQDLINDIGKTGMNDYLIKPFNAQELYRKLRDLLAASAALK